MATHARRQAPELGRLGADLADHQSASLETGFKAFRAELADSLDALEGSNALQNDIKTVLAKKICATLAEAWSPAAETTPAPQGYHHTEGRLYSPQRMRPTGPYGTQSFPTNHRSFFPSVPLATPRGIHSAPRQPRARQPE